MNEVINFLEKNAVQTKSNTLASNKKNNSVAKNSKKRATQTTLLDNAWEWENNPEYDEFWKNSL